LKQFLDKKELSTDELRLRRAEKKETECRCNEMRIDEGSGEKSRRA